ncbi:hypothetical protein [Marinobacter sp. R17]|uniref:hypothetical protein n=1 Tax=Marinobacter sp. R17 TaxID=2484250 RepID=UPI001CC1CD51|nr:hypothetical protein [Marinobacter sp. R17]
MASSKYVVVLAEPGGGKTELMRSLAEQLKTETISANKFRVLGAKTKKSPLVIDAFDELSKVDAAGIYTLLGQASQAEPTHVYVSSRSSEWDNASTRAFEEFIGHEPVVAQLCEFDETEQRAIFEHHAEGEEFSAFQAEVARFDLDPLLPNPQFLKLFIDAYIESERHFSDKQSIFTQAVERLAKETNAAVAKPNVALSTAQKVDIASEIFAKLLLSGADGVSTVEASTDRMYPLLASLYLPADGVSILATRLFKPSNSVDLHNPVHKIVTEYCAAGYLTGRISDPADSLTLSHCLPIIAPNATVRDELRGLLGWMACLGIKPVQRAAIELDPYAVLANGDPSLLEASSRRLLLERLKKVETTDPYFRRGDFGRRFSVAGFFSQDVVDTIKPLLMVGGAGHLRTLVLELLADSPAIELLTDELRQLVLSPDENETSRLLASRCILKLSEYDHVGALSVLLFEASHVSLRIAAETIEQLGPQTFDRNFLAGYFKVCSHLYPTREERLEAASDIGARLFIKQLIACLEVTTLEWLLDELSRGLQCRCGKEAYECDCRTGMSKIIGAMLDRFFELQSPPYDPVRVWGWVNKLNFHEPMTPDRSWAVRALAETKELRHGILKHVFGRLTEQEQIFTIRVTKFDWLSHSGLHFQARDDEFLVDYAYETDNPNLWVRFAALHQRHRNQEKKGPDFLRRHMREQALEKPAFMKAWVKANRDEALFHREHGISRLGRNRKINRRRRRQNETRLANIEFVRNNRELIESGQHWGCLVRFSGLALQAPHEIEHEFGDEAIVRNALKNCLEFITPYVPGLTELARLQCASQGLHSETILYASCLELLREKGNLEEVDTGLLKALRTNINMGYRDVSAEDRQALKHEVDRLIFPDAQSAEHFLREYLEPQLAEAGCSHPEVGLLRYDEAFADTRAALSIEWLRRFQDLDLESLDGLFEVAAQHGNRHELANIISDRTAKFLSDWPVPTDNEDLERKRRFWFLRAWYFLNNPPDACWNWLKTERNTVLLLQEQSGRTGFGNKSYWPKLTSEMVESVLEAFIPQWPKVDLPSHWDSSSPKEEIAYRFLTEVIWSMSSCDPDDAFPVLDRLISNAQFSDLHQDLKGIRARQVRKKALRDFEPPSPQDIVSLLDNNEVVTVEGLRQLVLDELQSYQEAIDGGEFNSADVFYEKGDRLDEIRSTLIIAERLSLKLEPRGISITPEHQLKDAKRSDFTATKLLDGKKRLLVTEVKGQWHRELYAAAATQLRERYSIHPAAEQQGIFLVIWFGPMYPVAGAKRHSVANAKELKLSIQDALPSELTGTIDIFVLDVSRTS